MPAKVNTKFVIILSTTIIALVLVLFGTYYVFVHRSSSRLERQADMLVTQGDLRLAFETYEKAIGKDRTKVQLIEKYLQTLNQVEALDRVDARNFIGKTGEALRMLTELQPSNIARKKDLYAHLMMLSNEFGQNDLLYQRANSNLENNPDDLVARKYRGIAQARMLSETMPRSDQVQAREDLGAYNRAHPGEPKVMYHLAKWNLFEARQQDRSAGNPDESERLRDAAVKITQRMLEQDPEDPHRQWMHVAILLDHRMMPRSRRQAIDRLTTIEPGAIVRLVEADPKIDQVELLSLNTIIRELRTHRLVEAAPIVEQLEQTLLSNPEKQRDSQLFQGGVSALIALAVGMSDPSIEASDLSRAQHLIETALATQPDAILCHMLLGTVLEKQRMYDEALAAYMQARSVKKPTKPVELWKNENMLAAASLRAGRLMLSRAEISKDPQQKEQYHDQIEQIINDLETIGIDSAPLNRLAGQLHFNRGEYLPAVQKLKNASDKFQNNNPEILLLLARAEQKTNDWGAATDHLKRLIELRPNVPQLKLHLAEIYLQHGEPDTAKDMLLALYPPDNLTPDDPKAEPNPDPETDATGVVLLASIYAREDQTDKAIHWYEKIDLDRYPAVAAELARLYVDNEQNDQAILLLEQRIAANPKDLRSLGQLLLLVDEQRRDELLANAEQAGVSPDKVEQLKKTLSGGQQRPQLTLDDVADTYASQQKDPLLQAVVRARLYNRGGAHDKAIAATEKAAAINPDHADVVDLRFRQALRDGNFEQAKHLASRAGQLNIDLAHGAFFEGQLAIAQKQWAQAAAALRRGLNARAIYSEGWRQLGDVLAQDNKYGDAADAYRRAIQQKPDNVVARVGLAQIELRSANHAAALQHMRSAHKAAPTNSKVLEGYLRLEQQYGSMETAIKVRQRLIKSAPGYVQNRRSLAMLLIDQAQHLENEVEQNPDDAEATQNRKQAQTYRTEGTQVITNLIEQEGRSRANVATFSYILRQLGDTEGGRREIENYIENRGDLVDELDYIFLAGYLIQIRQIDDALQAYFAGIALEDPEFNRVSRSLADTYFNLRRNAESIDIYLRLYEQNPQDTRLALRLAENLLRLERPDEAVQILDAEQLQHNIEAVTMRAILEIARNQTEEAMRLLNIAMRIDRSRAQTYYLRGQLLAADPAQLPAALTDLNRALELNPQLHQIFAPLANVHARMGNLKEAIRQLKFAIEADPTNQNFRLQLVQIYQSNNDSTNARRLLEQSAAEFPEQLGWTRLLAQQAMRDKNLPRAVEYMKQILPTAPTPQNVIVLAQLYLQQEKPANTLSLMKEHVVLVNQTPRLQAVRGTALVAQGQAEAAKQVFARALERCQNINQAEAVSHQMTAAFDPAESLKLASSITQRFDNLYFELLASRLQISMNQYSKALDRLGSIKPQLSPDNSRMRLIHRQLEGTALQGTGNYGKAREIYESLLVDYPNDLNTLNNLAYLLADNLGEPEAALSMAERAARLAPLNAHVLDTLGWVQFASGRTSEAKDNLEHSVELEELPLNVLHLGIVYEYFNIRERAREHYERAIGLAEMANEPDVRDKAKDRLSTLGN